MYFLSVLVLRLELKVFGKRLQVEGKGRKQALSLNTNNTPWNMVRYLLRLLLMAAHLGG